MGGIEEEGKDVRKSTKECVKDGDLFLEENIKGYKSSPSQSEIKNILLSKFLYYRIYDKHCNVFGYTVICTRSHKILVLSTL